MYRVQHLVMQTDFREISEKIGHSQQIGLNTMIGCHPCNKSSCEVTLKLNIPQSAGGPIHFSEVGHSA